VRLTHKRFLMIVFWSMFLFQFLAVYLKSANGLKLTSYVMLGAAAMLVIEIIREKFFLPKKK
jgi:hypothetical protein